MAAAISRRAARQLLVAAAVVQGGKAPVADDLVVAPIAQVPSPTSVFDSAVADLEVDAAPEGVASDAHSEQAAKEQQAADAFAAASHAFRTAAKDGLFVPASGPLDDKVDRTARAVPQADASHTPRRRRLPLRKFVTAGATMGVMGIAGLLAVSMTLPTEAVAAVQGAQVASATSLVASDRTANFSGAADEEIQAYVAPADVQNETLSHADDFSTVSLVDLAAEQGIRYSSEVYSNDPEAAIQWPFVVGVAMTWGFGMRDGRLHEGIDFVPGAGAPVQSIADGTVRIATESGGAYGVTVYIDHVVDGKVITSHYSHMQYGSLRVKPGQTVKVGEIVGLVGNTGRSYGAHLHFELIQNGATIDPMPWLKENAGRYLN